MEDLVELPDVEKLSAQTIRILGQNPGPYTLQGTNTYLISDERSVLVDAAEGEADYLPHLRSALSGRPPVSDIILTHWHHDHVLGLSDVLKLLDEVQKDAEKPKVWKHPSARPEHDSDVADQLKVAAGKFKAGSSSAGEHPLEEGQVFKLGGHSLQVVRTPGHTDDSISLILKNDASSSAPVIFTADTVLGQGTTVFEELGPYLASLKKLVDLAPQEPKTALYPGHGPVIEDGRAKMEQYIAHRLEREQQVIDALRNSKEASTTPEGLVKLIYPPQLPDAVVPAAARGLVQHLQKLEQEGKVTRSGDEGWSIAGSYSGKTTPLARY